MSTMTVLPWPDHLLTLEEWDALPEDTSRHFELAEGVLVVAPRPAPHHQTAVGSLMSDLNRQLPQTLAATQDIEVVIESTYPATVRAPDVVVISRSLYRRNPPRVDASEVLLAVEIVSPGSRNTDRVSKPVEYARAGIPHYWVIDLTTPATLVTYTLVEGGYQLLTKATGPITLSEPATLAVDVSKVTDPNYPWRDD